MMKRFAFFAVVLALAACNEAAPPSTDTASERAAIAVEYVRGDGLIVHAKPSDASPVLANFTSGESVSILAKQGEWAEVRMPDGSGWARISSLSKAVEAQHEEDNATPRFRKAPSPVTQPSAHGEIIIEAMVNTDGDVTSVKVTRNTTGSDALAFKNSAEIKSAKFEPIVQKGRRREFIYEYRVHY
jgi:uncharacterized protein YgiM (DUF1202 family)